MSRWIVALEGYATDDDALAQPEEMRAALLVALEAHRPAVAVGPRSWSVTIEVEFDEGRGDIRHVTEIAFGQVTAALAAAEAPGWPISRIDTARYDSIPGTGTAVLPLVVGLSEVLQLLGISKQQLAQLRQSGQFPHPIAVVRDTPIWAKTAVDGFVTKRRSPGPNITTAQSSNTVRVLGDGAELVAKRDGVPTPPPPEPNGPGSLDHVTLRPAVKP